MRARRKLECACLSLGWILTLFAWVSAVAAEERCPALTVEADPRVQTRWPDLVNGLRQAFASRDDIDACARVWLGMPGRSIEVAVVLPDGRSAARTLKRPAEVEPTLAGLLLLPMRSARASEPAPAPAQRAPADVPVAAIASIEAVRPASRPTQPRSIVRALPADMAAAPESEPPVVGFEFSLVSAARAGDGMMSVGVGALSLLDLSSWLIGFEGRLEGYSPFGAGEGVRPTLCLAVLGGYRFRFGTMALDLAAGPALTMIAAEVSSAPVIEPRSRPSMQMDEGTGMPLLPRLAVAAHHHFAARSLFRTFVGIDGQFGPAHPPGEDAPGSAALPTWGVGLVLGATVGTR